MISNQEDVKLDFEVKEEDMPKADADLSHTLDSIERMLSLSPNKEVLKNLLDVVVSNEGVSENPDQASRLDQLKVKIVAKLGGEISESASCGATSSCSIATVAEPLTSGKKKKVKPIRRKIVGIDALSFMECVNNDIPSVVHIRDVVFKNSLVGKHPVLMANECVVPVYGKEKINNLVKKYYLDGEDFEICESVISPVDFLIMRGEIICESDDLKFDDKKAQQEKDDPQIDANLRNQVGRQTIATVEKNKSGDNSGKTSDDIKTNQELVGVDDSDPTQKKYVIKDPQTGKISVKKQSEVAIQNEAVKYYKKPLNESDLEETKASRFNQHLDNREQSFATISAERTNDVVRRKFGAKTDVEYMNNDERNNDPNYQKFIAFNHRRTNKLYKLLKQLGVQGFIKMKGGFKEVDSNSWLQRLYKLLKFWGKKSYVDNHEEDSVFIPNITLEQAIRIGKMFHQDSIMFKEAGSNEIKEYATNQEKVADVNSDKDENDKIKLGGETGLAFVCCQGRTNNQVDKTYFSRPTKTSTKFAFNLNDETGKVRTKKNSFFDRKFRSKPDEEELYKQNSSYKEFDKG